MTSVGTMTRWQLFSKLAFNGHLWSRPKEHSSFQTLLGGCHPYLDRNHSAPMTGVCVNMLLPFSTIPLYSVLSALRSFTLCFFHIALTHTSFFSSSSPYLSTDLPLLLLSIPISLFPSLYLCLPLLHLSFSISLSPFLLFLSISSAKGERMG